MGVTYVCDMCNRPIENPEDSGLIQIDTRGIEGEMWPRTYITHPRCRQVIIDRIEWRHKTS